MTLNVERRKNVSDHERTSILACCTTLHLVVDGSLGLIRCGKMDLLGQILLLTLNIIKVLLKAWSEIRLAIVIFTIIRLE
jgi:hypothetical protein